MKYTSTTAAYSNNNKTSPLEFISGTSEWYKIGKSINKFIILIGQKQLKQNASSKNVTIQIYVHILVNQDSLM